MSGIVGMGTTYNLPNYVGELFAITPEDTPLLSSIGGLTGGKSVSATEWSWQTFDQRDPSSRRTRLEGADAPNAEERLRATIKNVVEIHQEKVSLSYTKQAATQQIATPSAAPYQVNGGLSNPIMSELDWQILRAIKAIALDVNYSFINGTFLQPTDNTQARRTRGLLQAVQTNRIAKGVSTSGGTSATDTITFASHGLTDGTKIVFTNTDVATNIVAGRVYYVVSSAASTFKVATSLGGSALVLGTASNLAWTKPSAVDLSTDDVNDLLQLAFDNGGISEQHTATLLCNSSQKRAVTKAYMSAYGKFQEMSRNVGGVNVQTVVTDFGTLNLMMDRHVPQDTLVAVSLEQLNPVFLAIPGKGHFFQEDLAKTGAADNVQIYGEIGLEYGNERAHAVLTGLKV
jgi:hypothetical protein